MLVLDVLRPFEYEQEHHFIEHEHVGGQKDVGKDESGRKDLPNTVLCGCCNSHESECAGKLTLKTGMRRGVHELSFVGSSH